MKKMNQRKSKRYQFTGYIDDALSYFQLAELRKAVKTINKLSKGQKYRVEVRGRLGKNNPAYESSYKYTWNGTSYIRLADATRYDVYIYER